MWWWEEKSLLLLGFKPGSLVSHYTKLFQLPQMTVTRQNINMQKRKHANGVSTLSSFPLQISTSSKDNETNKETEVPEITNPPTFLTSVRPNN
jgi:hypothetical protein